MAKQATPDLHVLVPSPAHGPGVYHVVNPRTGEQVERCGNLADAIAAQAKWNTTSTNRINNA